jgi:hypothetical protein
MCSSFGLLRKCPGHFDLFSIWLAETWQQPRYVTSRCRCSPRTYHASHRHDKQLACRSLMFNTPPHQHDQTWIL